MKKITLVIFMSLLSFLGYAQFPEGFEGATFPPAGWTVSDNGVGTSTSWVSNTAFPHTGAKATFINTDANGIGTTTEDWLTSPLVTMPTNGQLRFWLRQLFVGDQGTIIKVMVSTTSQTDHTTFSTVATFTETQLGDTNNSLYFEHKADFPATLFGQSVYIAIVRQVTQTVAAPPNPGDRMLIDDINLVTKCLDPIGPNATNITTNSASLSWINPSGATQWEIELVNLTAGGTPTGVGTLVNQNPYPKTGLLPGTNYSYYVRALCSNGIYSDWVGPLSFATKALGSSCAEPIAFNALPYSHTSNTLIYNDVIEGSPGTSCGITGNYLNGNEVVYAYTAGFTGIVDITMTPGGTNSGVFVYSSCANINVQCLAGVANAGTAPRVITNFPVTNGTTYYIVISTNGTPQTIDYTLTLQQVNCLPPNALGVAGVTQTGATLQWGVTGTAASWQYVLQAPGSGIPSGVGTTAGTNSAAVTGLTASTQYEFYVRADCGDGTFSAWAGPFLFYTLCSPYPVAFFEGFNAVTPSASTSERCWTVLNGNADGNAWDMNYASTPFEGDQAASIVASSSTNDDWLISPQVTLNGNQRLRYRYKVLSSTSPCNFEVKFSTTGPNAAGFAGAANTLVAQTIYNNGTYVEKFVNLTGITGDVNIGWHVAPGANGSRIFIDAVIVENIPPCPQPIDIAVSSITPTSASVNWTSGTETSWQVVVQPTGSAAPTLPTQGVTVNTPPPYAATGLVSSTTYDVYVLANCGVDGTSVWSGPITFTTSIAPPVCGGTFFDLGGSAANYTNNERSTWVIYPATPGDVVTVTFTSFNVQANNDGLYVYNGNSTSAPQFPSTNGAGTPLGFPGAYWGTTIPGPFTSSAPDGSLTFSFASDATTTAAGWQANVTCAPRPTCEAPVSITQSGVTSNSVNLAWVGGNATAWEVIAVPCGSPRPTGATAGWVSAPTNPFTLTGLNGVTCYNFYVRGICSPTDASTVTGPVSATTPCSVFNVPFQEGFNSTSTSQQCWTVVNANGDTDQWDMDYVTTPFEGNQVAMMYTDFNAGANDDWLISPVINLSSTPGPKRLKFHYKVQSAGEPNDFRVMLSTSGPATANFTQTIIPLASYDNTTYVERIVNLIGPGNVPYTGNVNIAWHVPPGGLDGWRLYVDNVIIEDMPTCPSPTNAVVNSVTQTSATFSWTPGFTETAWDLVIQAPGAGTPTGASTIIPAGTNTNFTVSTGLNPSTNYEYWVRAHCSGTDQSVWVGPIPFSTTQIPAPLNFSDNFEGASGFTLVNGTQTNKWVIGTAVNNGGTRSLYITNNGGTSNAYTTGNASTVQAYRDIAVPAGVNLMNLSFDWRAVGESCCDYVRVWIVPTSFTPTPGTQITGAAPAFLQLSPNLNQGATFTRASYDIPGANYAGQTIRLVFEWRNDTSVGTQPPGAIDNVNLTIVTCPKPTALVVTNVTQNSATVSWTPGGTETQWELVVQPVGSGVPTGASTIIPVSAPLPYLVTGLNPATNYEYYVRAVCSASDSSLWAGPKTFSTTQIPAIVNYVEDFESSPQWTFVNGTQTNKWMVGSATSNGGAQSLYISNNNAANAYTTSSSSTVQAYRDIAIPAGTNLMNLSFDWKAQGESGFDFLRVWTVPATFTPTAGTQITAASGGQQLSPNLNSRSTWGTQAYELTAGAYAGQIMRLVFEWRNDSSGGTQPPAAVDNINLTIPTCPVPYNLMTSGQSGSPLITLSWTPGGTETQWELVIQPQGTGVPTGASTIIQVNGTPSYTFSGSNGVFYEFYVRAICGVTDSSTWAGPTLFSIYAPPGCASVDVVGVGIDVVNNEVLLCPGTAAQDVQLSASYFGIGGTTSYSVSSIDYNPPFAFTGGIQMPITSDDDYTASFNLPFNFCFFGQAYNYCRVGDNGVITFGLPPTTTYGEYCEWDLNNLTIPNTSFPIKNSIYGVYQDNFTTNNPGTTTSVNYQVLGSYPCRALVVNFNEVPLYGSSCTDASYRTTSQIVLYEISNIIEVYVKRRVPCTSWSDGAGVLGIQNSAGTLAYTPPGRNTGAWSATNEAWRFTPNAPATVNLEWIQNGVVIGTNNNITVSVNDDTTVTAQATYTQCDGSTVVKTSNIDIVVTEELPTLEPHNMFACSNLSNPTFDLTQNGDYVLSNSTAANYTIKYYTSLAAAQAAVPGTEIPNPTAYVGTNGETIYMNITSNAHCTVIKSFQLAFSTIVPDYTLAGVTNGGLTICNSASATISVLANNYDGTTAFYEWVDPNGVVLAETSAVLHLPAGAVPGTYQVTVDTGCKTTKTFVVNVVQITGVPNSPTADCANSVATLVVTASGGLNYEYSFDGGLTFQSSNQYTNGPGIYPIVIRDIDTGCMSAVFNGVINQNPNAPTAPILGPPVNQTCAANGVVTVLSPVNGPVRYSNLFISEVTDSNTGSLTYVEIFNGTGAPVNLSGYKLKFYTTLTGPASCDFTLVGMLANGATHIVKVSSDANIPGVVPNQTVTLCTGVNNNDRIYLTTSTGSQSVIDVWGTPDLTVFTPAGQTGYTYRRINSAVIPNTVWNPADWNAIDPEVYTDLGTYVPATTNYHYSLDGGTPQTGLVFTNVPAGNHVVTVVDMTTGCVSGGTPITIGAAQQPSITYASPFCQGTGLVMPTAQTGEANGVYSSTAGLVINSVTGEIDLNTSAPGTYTVSYTITGSVNCTPATYTVVINAPALPETGFSYPTPICSNGVNPTPTGLPGFVIGGTYSSTTGLTIDAVTGEIDLTNSVPGTYTVTYAVLAGPCSQPGSSSFVVTITEAPTASISYTGTPFCTTAATASVTLSGTAAYTGGTYSSTTGLVIDPVTGDITPSTSTPGTYTVTYMIPASAGCFSVPVTTSVTITEAPTAAISYAGTPFCSTVTSGAVSLSGTAAYTGGTYSSTTGLTINASTGEITPSTSTPGIYTVTYTVPASAGCSLVQATTTVTVTAAPSAVISYLGTPFCSGTGLATVTQTGSVGGSYSSTSGLVIDPSTGEINIGNSAPGTYVVTYTIAASGECGTYTTTTSITISQPILVTASGGCLNQSYVLSPNPVNSNYTYEWFDPSGVSIGVGTTVVVTSSGIYEVHMTTDEGCVSQATVEVLSAICEIPKGISPNGDGLNDSFDITGLQARSVEIFNRYGMKVYTHGSGYTKQWHGQSDSGQELPDGTYYYVINTAEGKTKTGWVYINRER
jgi:gliding motility-associated-like protein